MPVTVIVSNRGVEFKPYLTVARAILFLSHVKNVRYGTFDWAYPVSCCKDDAEQMETQRDKAVVPVKVCLLDAYR
jgi:hypothetical protein